MFPPGLSDKPTQIVVDVKPADPAKIHQGPWPLASAASSEKRLHRKISRKCSPMPRTRKMLSSTARFSPQRGSASRKHNDSPTLFNGNETYRAYVPRGILDSEDATIALVSAAVPDKCTPAWSIKLVDGAAIDPANMSYLLPPEDSVVVPGKAPMLQLEVAVHGQKRLIAFPAPSIARSDSDLARHATVTASSTEKGYRPAGVIDGVADGFPGDKRYEWASDGKQANASITLTWAQPQSISKVSLFDRPNPDDQVTSGQLIFDDGSKVSFGELANDGKTATTVSFPAKNVLWMRAEITGVSPTTKSAGFSEIAAFK